jgi:fructose 1,6-bisphosphate aldolase/phosphatase
MDCAKLAKSMKLYGAGQDLLKDSFSGNLKGMGPGTAEMEIEERPSEPIIIFMADKTEPGAWNMPLFRMFADPFSTAGLVIDPTLHAGFEFEVHDVMKSRKIRFKLPEEMYDMLALIGQPGRFVIKKIFRRTDSEIAAASSSERLNLIAGKYVGKDDPVLIVRAQSGFPAVGEVVEPFAFPHLVAGWMRGSHHGPLMPVGQKNAQPTRFDGPPRVIALGFQLNNGKFGLPVDLFEDISFDRARQKANEVADYMRRHGPFEAHRLSAEEMEYTTLPDVMKKLEGRWKEI